MSMKQIGLFTAQIDSTDPIKPPPWVAALPLPVTRIWEACRRAPVRLRPRAWGIGRKGTRWVYTDTCACAIGVFLVEAEIPALKDESAGGSAARALRVPTSLVYSFAHGFDGSVSYNVNNDWFRAGYAMRRLVP